MASLYPMKRSPFWWVAFTDPKTGKRTCKSTGFRRDDPLEHKKARAVEAELTAREFNRATHHSSEKWEGWVLPFLKRHCKSPRTLCRYELAWSWISIYLKEKRIFMPKDMTYQDAIDYVKWRTSYKKRGGRTVKHNTALNDMKVFRIIMGQAIRLGYCTTNPCNRLGVAKEETKEKPELTDDDITTIREALKKRDEQEPWMRISFEIALHTGCRQSETQIAMKNIDFNRNTITFASPKGGKSRAFSVPLPEAIKPMLLKLKNAGAEFTLDKPPRMLGKHWWQFFKNDVKRPDLCFHCTRVSFVTRLARASVPLSAAMRLVNHSSTLIHAIYQRLGVDDVRDWAAKIAIPAA